MHKNRWFLLALLALASACEQGKLSNQSDSHDEAQGGAVGALIVATQVTDTTVDRVEYTLLARSGTSPELRGTLAVADGLAQGQVQVPVDVSFDVKLRLLAKGTPRCEGQARDLTVSA